MKSRITKLAVAAVIIIVAIAGIRHFTGSIDGASVAWGEVLNKVEQIPAVVLRMTSVTGFEHEGEDKTASTEAVVYLATDYGSRADRYMDGELIEKRYRIADENTCYWVFPKEKRYLRIVLPENSAGEAGRKSDPREWVKEILSEDYVELGRDKIDGIEVEGVEVQKPMMGGDRGVVRLWVDVESNLPVRIETDAAMAIQGKDTSTRIVMDNFQWNVGLEAAVFEPDIPADYTLVAKSAWTELHGPKIHSLDDGSVVKLADGAKIRLYESTSKRGFEHIAGEIEVTVAKAVEEFVVTTAFGTVRALGTTFAMDLINTTSQGSRDKIEILAVAVKKGTVEVSNPEGSKIVRENQSVTVGRNEEPYDFRQDENLPERLVERIQAMLDAFEAGDKRAWIANFNIEALYDLVKGNIEYSDHPDWFSGMDEEDARRIREGFADVNSLEEMVERALPEININEPHKIYVQSVSMDPDGEHAAARCVEVRGERRYLVTTPQWTYFDDDWWQTDD